MLFSTWWHMDTHKIEFLCRQDAGEQRQRFVAWETKRKWGEPQSKAANFPCDTTPASVRLTPSSDTVHALWMCCTTRENTSLKYRVALKTTDKCYSCGNLLHHNTHATLNTCWSYCSQSFYFTSGLQDYMWQQSTTKKSRPTIITCSAVCNRLPAFIALCLLYNPQLMFWFTLTTLINVGFV